MNSCFDNVLNGLCGRISNFTCSSFISKNIFPPKERHVLASVIFSKSVQNMKVKFDMTTRQRKQFLSVCKQHMLSVFFLLTMLMS